MHGSKQWESKEIHSSTKLALLLHKLSHHDRYHPSLANLDHRDESMALQIALHGAITFVAMHSSKNKGYSCMVVEQWNDYLDMSKDDTGVQSGPIPVDKGMNEGVKGKKIYRLSDHRVALFHNKQFELAWALIFQKLWFVRQDVFTTTCLGRTSYLITEPRGATLVFECGT